MSQNSRRIKNALKMDKKKARKAESKAGKGRWKQKTDKRGLEHRHALLNLAQLTFNAQIADGLRTL